MGLALKALCNIGEPSALFFHPGENLTDKQDDKGYRQNIAYHRNEKRGPVGQAERYAERNCAAQLYDRHHGHTERGQHPAETGLCEPFDNRLQFQSSVFQTLAGANRFSAVRAP